MPALHGCPWTSPGDLFYYSLLQRCHMEVSMNTPAFLVTTENPIFSHPIDVLFLLFPFWVPELFSECSSKVPSVLPKEIVLWQWTMQTLLNNILYVSFLTAFKFCLEVPAKSWKDQQRENVVASWHSQRSYSVWWNVLLLWIYPQAWCCWRKYHVSQSIK